MQGDCVRSADSTTSPAGIRSVIFLGHGLSLPQPKLHTVGVMTTLAENPFAVLTLIAAPAVFTNASSVLALGTGNRLGRVVDRTRYLAHELHSSQIRDETTQLWVDHLGRLEQRGALLVRAMSFFYGAI